jgi:tetratricopeptide (TPR) repeat protein
LTEKFFELTGRVWPRTQSLHAALLLHRQGRLDEAAQLYKLVLRSDRSHFEALHNLGIVRISQGKPGDAVKLIRRALYERPNSPEAHNSLGSALHSMDRRDEALVHYQKAIALRPDYLEALNNTAVLLQSLNRGAEAVSHYEKVLAIKPDFAGAHDHIARALRALNRHQEAVAHYEKAIDLDPQKADLHTRLGIALQELGMLDRALDAHARAIELAPDNTGFYLELAQCKRFTRDDPHLAAMQKLACGMISLSDEAQMHLHFALGKAFEDLGQYEQAFSHLIAGNALKRKQTAYDEVATLGLLDRIRSVFTHNLLHGPPRGHASSVPVFIIGMPRSGTTLIEQILASHSMVHGGGELMEFETVLGQLTGTRGSRVTFPEEIPDLDDELLQKLGNRYVDAVRAYGSAERITDKMPSNFRFAGLIHLALPHARIIHARRDPIDTCLSCFSKLFAGDHPYVYELGELGRYYRAYDTLMAHWRAVLPKGVMLEVQYEELVGDIETQARNIVGHCGLEWEDACLAFHRTERSIRTASFAQVRQPIYRSSVGRWRPRQDVLSPLIDALGGATPLRTGVIHSDRS